MTGPLLLVVALVSVVALRCFMLQAEKKSGSGAINQPNQAKPTSSPQAGPIAPSSNTCCAEASAVSQSDAGAPSHQHVASKNSSSFVEDYHLALQLKSANKLGDAGQCLSLALFKHRARNRRAQIHSALFRSLTAKAGQHSICC